MVRLIVDMLNVKEEVAELEDELTVAMSKTIQMNSINWIDGVYISWENPRKVLKIFLIKNIDSMVP